MAKKLMALSIIFVLVCSFVAGCGIVELPPETHTVKFDTNGATGTAINDMVVQANDEITLPESESLKKTYNYFDNWNTNANGTGTSYAIGEKYTVTGDVTFYAIWNHYGDLVIDAKSIIRGETAEIEEIQYSFNNPYAELVSIEYYIDEVDEENLLPDGIPEERTPGIYRVVITAKDDKQEVSKVVTYKIVEGDYEPIKIISADDIVAYYNGAVPSFNYELNRLEEDCKVDFEYYLNGNKLESRPTAPNIYEVKILAYDFDDDDEFYDNIEVAYSIVFETALDAYNYGSAFYRNTFDNGGSLRHTRVGTSATSVATVDTQMYRLITDGQIFEESMQHTGVALAASAKMAEQVIIGQDKNMEKRTTSSSARNPSSGALICITSDWKNSLKTGITASYTGSEGIFYPNYYDVTSQTIINPDETGFDSNNAINEKYYQYTFEFNQDGHGSLYRSWVNNNPTGAVYKEFKYLRFTVFQDLQGKIYRIDVEEKYSVEVKVIIIVTQDTTNNFTNLIKYDGVVKPEGIGFTENNWFNEFYINMA